MATRDQVYVDIITETKKSVGSLLKYAAAIGGAYLAVKKMYAVAKDLVRTFSVQEQAEAKLSSAIRSTGKEATISAQSLYDYAAELQNVTTYGDEATISAMALLQQLGDLSKKGLKQITPLLQDFASTGMVNLETAASLVGKTLGSTTNALTRYGIVIDMSGTKQEKLAEITKALQAKFGGLSQDLATEATAALVQFNNAVGDLREAQGKAIAEGIEPYVRGLTKIIKEMAAAKLEAIATKQAYKDLKNLGEEQVLAEGQQLLILKDQVDQLGRMAASYMMLDEAANAAYEAAKQRVKSYKAASAAVEMAEARRAEASDEATRKAAEKELAEAKAAKEMIEWQQMVNDKYGETEAAQKAILAAEIAKWEYELTKSDVYKPKIEAIIEMLYEQRDATKEVTAVVSDLNDMSQYLGVTQQDLLDIEIALSAWRRQSVDDIKDQIDAIKELTEEQQIMASIATDAFVAFGKAFADAAIEGGEIFKEAMKAGVASAVEALAMMAMAEAGIALASLNFVKAAALFGAGVAAFAAATGIRALGEGGIVTKPTLALVGEKGPEEWRPLSKARAIGPSIVQHFHIQGSMITREELMREAESRVMGRLTRVY